MRFFLPLDILDDRQVQELRMTERLRDTLATHDHVIVNGLPVVQVSVRARASNLNCADLLSKWANYGKMQTFACVYQ